MLFATRNRSSSCGLLIVLCFLQPVVAQAQKPAANSSGQGLPSATSDAGQNPLGDFARRFGQQLWETARDYGINTAKTVVLGVACAQDPATCIQAIKAIKGPELEDARAKGSLREFVETEALDGLETAEELLHDGVSLAPGMSDYLKVLIGAGDAFLETKEDVEARLQKAEKALADGRRAQMEAEAKIPKQTTQDPTDGPDNPPPPPEKKASRDDPAAKGTSDGSELDKALDENITREMGPDDTYLPDFLIEQARQRHNQLLTEQQDLTQQLKAYSEEIDLNKDRILTLEQQQNNEYASSKTAFDGMYHRFDFGQFSQQHADTSFRSQAGASDLLQILSQGLLRSSQYAQQQRTWTAPQRYPTQSYRLPAISGYRPTLSQPASAIRPCNLNLGLPTVTGNSVFGIMGNQIKAMGNLLDQMAACNNWGTSSATKK